MGGSFGYGLRRAMTEIVLGFVTSVTMDAIIGTGLLPPAYVVLFSVGNMLSAVVLIAAMPLWGTIYLAGWLFGLSVMLQTGMVGVLDVVVYFGVPLAVLVVRFWKMLTDWK